MKPPAHASPRVHTHTRTPGWHLAPKDTLPCRRTHARTNANPPCLLPQPRDRPRGVSLRGQPAGRGADARLPGRGGAVVRRPPAASAGVPAGAAGRGAGDGGGGRGAKKTTRSVRKSAAGSGCRAGGEGGRAGERCLAIESLHVGHSCAADCDLGGGGPYKACTALRAGVEILASPLPCLCGPSGRGSELGPRPALPLLPAFPLTSPPPTLPPPPHAHTHAACHPACPPTTHTHAPPPAGEH